MRRFILAICLLAPVCIQARAQSQSVAVPDQASGMRAEHPWARATAPRQTVGGVYVTLTSRTDDRLLGASSPAAGQAEMHEMTMKGDVMRMRELTGGLKLPAGKAVALTPGGFHIMLVNLRQPLVAGQVIPVRLRFEHAAPIDLDVPVAAVGAQRPAMSPAMEHAK